MGGFESGVYFSENIFSLSAWTHQKFVCSQKILLFPFAFPLWSDLGLFPKTCCMVRNQLGIQIPKLPITFSIWKPNSKVLIFVDFLCPTSGPMWLVNGICFSSMSSSLILEMKTKMIIPNLKTGVQSRKVSNEFDKTPNFGDINMVIGEAAQSFMARC